MGADYFLAFYGIKIALDPDDESEQDACGLDIDQRCIRAKSARLRTHTGRMTEGTDCFLYIGRKLASIGVEADRCSRPARSWPAAELRCCRGRFAPATTGRQIAIRWLHGAKRRTITRIKPTPGEKAYNFLAFRGLSAAPLGGKGRPQRLGLRYWRAFLAWRT